MYPTQDKPRDSVGRDSAMGSGRPLVVALGLVVAVFVGSTFYVYTTARSIDESAATIGENAAPSIAHLSRARSEMFELRHELRVYMSTVDAGRMPPPESLRATGARLGDELNAYAALPKFPGERELALDLQRNLAALDATIVRIIDAVHRGRADEARALADGTLAETVASVRADMIQLTDLNAWFARDAAQRITRVRRHAGHTALALSLLSVALAAVAAVIARRAIRRNEVLLEASRRAADERATELEAFAGRVAHDVRSPLAPVSLALDLAERRVANDPRTLEALVRARRGLRRVGTTVDGLLEFANAGAHSKPGARAEIAPVVDDLVGEVTPDAEAAGIELRVEPLARGVVAASPGVLTSAVGNLLRNAVKYIGRGSVRRVTIRVRDTGPRARIEVEDTGPGVPPGLRAAVFEPHVRGPDAQQPGFGLGLATVKRVCDAHDGATGYEPATDGGSLFWIELPWAADEPPAAQSSHPVDPSRRRLRSVPSGEHGTKH
jgi:signal transduction histidine kinase